jgi:hypothetical protein
VIGFVLVKMPLRLKDSIGCAIACAAATSPSMKTTTDEANPVREKFVDFRSCAKSELNGA